MKSLSREIGSLNYRIVLKIDKHLGSTAADLPVIILSDRTILNINLEASRFCEILQYDVLSDIETVLWFPHYSVLHVSLIKSHCRNCRILRNFLYQGLPFLRIGSDDLSVSLWPGPLFTKSYCQISWSLKAARLNVLMIESLWNLTGMSTVLLHKSLSNITAIAKV